MELNKKQRIFMSVMGAAILIFQMYKFSEDGIEGYSWIFSILVSVGLMLPIMGGAGEKKTGKSKKNNKEEVDFNLLEQQIKPMMTTINFESTILYTTVMSFLKVSPKEDFEKAAIMALMMDQWRVYCVAYVYALVCLIESYKDEDFPGSNKYGLLKLRSVEYMVKISKDSAEKNNIGLKFDPNSAKKLALKDIDDAEIAVNNMTDNFAKNKTNPDSVMAEYLCEKMKIPEDVRDAFISKVRAYTKSTLGSLKKGYR